MILADTAQLEFRSSKRRRVFGFCTVYKHATPNGVKRSGCRKEKLQVDCLQPGENARLAQYPPVDHLYLSFHANWFTLTLLHPTTVRVGKCAVCLHRKGFVTR
jgi:hypothetical protein